MPAAVRYFEDFRPGDVIELGSRTITKVVLTIKGLSLLGRRPA